MEGPGTFGRRQAQLVSQKKVILRERVCYVSSQTLFNEEGLSWLGLRLAESRPIGYNQEHECKPQNAFYFSSSWQSHERYK